MTDRLRAAFGSAVGGTLPSLANYVKWRYRVVSVTPGQPVQISGVPVSTACPHGQLANIALWPGPDGGYAIPPVGSLVLIEFVEGDPEQPAVCALDPSVTPTLTTLGGGVSPVARVGDTITITQAQFAAAGAANGAGAVATAGPMQGTITSGSAKVQAG